METVKQKKEKPPKPKFGMCSNAAYMIGKAWRTQKSVLWLCVAGAALAVASNLLELFAAPAVLGAVETDAPLPTLLGTILFFALGLALAAAASAYVGENTLFGRVAVRFDIVVDIHDKFARTSYPNTEEQAHRRLFDQARRTTISNSKATEAIWNTLGGLLENLAGFAVYLALLASVDLPMVLLTLATTVTGHFVSRYIDGWDYRHRDEEAEHSRRMRYVSEKAQDYKLAKDARIFGMRGWLEDAYQSALRAYRAFAARRERVYIWGNVADAALSFLRNGIAYAYLIALTLDGGLSAAQFLLYFSAVGGFTGWVSGILSGFSQLHRQSLDLSTLREALTMSEPFRFEDGEPLEASPDKPCEITFQNVSFRYPGAETDTLKNLNLTIRAGEKLAVVGLNGAGKTTMVKLACGFYDPTGGAVLLNGEDIRKFNRRDYYRHFAAVFQQFSLLDATVAENVAQTAEGIDTERVRDCLARAGLAERVVQLPGGLETHLGREVYEDGVELSGGETQRLMLARALYKDAPVLVLDEPTAALDPLAESDLYRRYNELAGGRTSVYISHRLASTRFCDRILLLKDGVIAEEGTHEALIAQGGRYAELFETQSRYYREGGDDHGEA